MNRLALILTALGLLVASEAHAAVTGCFQSLAGAINQQVTARSGNVYTSDSNGNICGVSANDFSDLERSGYVSMSTPQATVPFTTLPAENPLTLTTYQDIPVASVSTAFAYTIVASAANRQVFPTGGLSIMVSGTAGGSTSLNLQCSDGTNVATFPIAMLVNNTPVGPYASAGVITRGVGMTQGCPAGTALQLSEVGSALTTTSHIYVNVPYIIK